MGRVRQTVVIFLVSLAGLLLEVGYTRIISFKLWYYYIYLVIGLALLGIGSGNRTVDGAPRARCEHRRIIAVSAIRGAVVPIGYLIVARLPSTPS